ncbi:MAG: hypothetical protein FWH28_02770 [Clostridiales bacterium]|nr:hypothetical protein [Clostridiales bacterium]
MDKIDLFLEAEKKRLETIAVPSRYERVVRDALTEAGLGAEEMDKALPGAGRTADGGLAETGASGGQRKKAGKASRWFWIPAVAACVALFLALQAFWPILERFREEDMPVPLSLPESFSGVISIKPLLGAEEKIDLVEGFLISSTEAIPRELAEKALVLDPEFDFELIARRGGREYELVPVAPLIENSVYRIAFDPENSLADRNARGSHTWAFQTTAAFSLRETLPRTNTNMAPVTTSFALRFTAAPEQDDLERLVGFVPPVPGSWVIENQSALYLPDQPLAYNTVYEIHIAGGIRESGGPGKTSEAMTVVFHTENAPDQENFYFSIQGQNLAFRTDEAPAIQFYFNAWESGEESAAPDVEVKLFSFPSSLHYQRFLTEKLKDRAWLYANEDIPVSVEGLTPLADFILTGHPLDYSWYLVFPEALPKGFYLAEFRLQGQLRQFLFQVTDLSAYLSANDREALIWVNDLSTGFAAGQAEIRINENERIYTDENGVAYSKNLPSGQALRVVDIRYEGDQILLADTDESYGNPDQQQWLTNRRTAQNYWNYLYVDKPLYRPGDKLYFFGLLTPRSPSVPPVRDAILRLENGRTEMHITQDCAVIDDVLQGSLTLPVLSPGFYYLSLYLDDAFICASYFEVAIYEKPAYRISLAADKPIVMKGENVQWTATTAFFDGTPMGEQSILFYGSSIGNDRTITSGSQGEITFSTKALGSDYSITGSDRVSAVATFPEMGEIYRESQVLVFNSDLELRGTAARFSSAPLSEAYLLVSGNDLPDAMEREPGEEEAQDYFTIDLEAFGVDIGRIFDPEGDILAQALTPYRDSIRLQASLVRQYWEKIETGQHYDPFTKQMTPTFEYRFQEIPESEFIWTWSGVENGVTMFQESLQYPDAYQLTISFTDRAGRVASRQFFLPEAKRASAENAYPYVWYWLSRDNGAQYCRTGETVVYQLHAGEAPLSGEGQYLFFRAGDFIKEYTVTEENRYAFLFDERELPGANIMAVFFDGSRYLQAAYAASALPDPGDRALQLTMQTDKERYSPGDTVILDMQLRNHRGQPVQGVINLNLVDEALLALRDQWVDIGRQVLHYNSYDYTYRTVVSHPSSDGGPMAEGGEGDGGRDDFRDTVLFRMLYTDPQGRIRIEFTLPDNITKWRVIWQAYTRDIRVGSGTGSITVSRPFFADIRFNGPILETDEPVLGMRAAGSVLQAEEMPATVTWTVLIPELDFTQSLSGAAFGWQNLQLPSMPEGEYLLQVHCVWEQYSDSVTQFFRVQKSMFSHSVREEAQLTEEYKISGHDEGMTTVVFSDTYRNQAMRGLVELAGQASVRVEQRIAALEAGKLLQSTFGLDWWSLSAQDERTEREQILRYQLYDGGVAYLPYGESDPYTSVWAASAAGEYFSKEDLALYFSRMMEEKTEDDHDGTLALWGMAACGKPVLGEIRRALRENRFQGEELTGQQKLNLICAMLFIGNGNEAVGYAEELLRQWTEEVDGLVRASIGLGRTETLKATAQMAVVAGMLGLPQSTGLYQYVQENQSEEEYVLLEKLLWLRTVSDNMPESASFAYIMGGEEIFVDLSKSPNLTLTLAPEQRERFAISQVNGQVIGESFYQKDGWEEPGEMVMGQISIQRSYTVGGQESRSLPMNGKIQVEIHFRIEESAPDGCYTIVDYLPAGLRYVSMDTTAYEAYENPVWLLMEEGNRLTFGVYKQGSMIEKVVRYNVRVAMPGSYLAEPAVLGLTMRPGFYTAAAEDRIYIN